MMMTLLAVLPLALQDPLFVEDEWESWSSFAVGSSVTYEVDVAGREPKVKRTVTLKSKASDALVTVQSEADAEPEEETIAKPSEKPTAPDPSVKCVLCGKHVAVEYKQSKEKLKIGDREIECTVLDLKTYDCKSTVSLHQRTWYSKEVPGWRAKVETELPGLPKSTVTCVAFTKK